MIIARLLGGLGNQMFQYATGRRLSLQTGLPLWLDIGFYDRDPERFRKFELDGLRATWDGLLHLPADVDGKVFVPQPGAPAHRVVREKKFSFEPSVLETSGSAYLDGDWQSERYFDSIRDTLLGDFAVRREPDAANQATLAAIAATNSVCVHRGAATTSPNRPTTASAPPSTTRRGASDLRGSCATPASSSSPTTPSGRGASSRTGRGCTSSITIRPASPTKTCA